MATKGGFSVADASPEALRARSRRVSGACGASASASTICTASIPRSRSSRASPSWRSIATPARSDTSASPRRALSRSSGHAPWCRSTPSRTTTTSPSEGTRRSSTTALRRGSCSCPYFPLRGGGPPELDEIAARHGASPAQITLAWLLRRSPTMLPIPGTLSLAHLRENLDALEIELTDSEFQALM